MSKRIDDAMPGPATPVLRPELLARIHALNADYLELLAAEGGLSAHAAQLQYFPPNLRLPLAELTSSSRLNVSKVPYSLYSLCFQDVRFWQSACEAGTDSFASRYTSNTSASLQGTFCEIALIQAWQVVLGHPLAARVLYAIDDCVATLLTRTALWQIRRIAGDYPGLLLPRWPANPGFWPDLLAFAAAGDAKRLATTRLLGAQLMAGELGASAERAATSPGRLRRNRRGIGLRSPSAVRPRAR